MNSTFSNLIATIVVAVCFLTLASTSSAQDQTKFILKLNDSLVNNMKSLGSLNSVVPDDAQGKVAVVELKFDSTDPTAEVLQSGPVSEVLDDACMIDLTQELIEKARSNPLRFEIPSGSKFSKVFLNYPIDLELDTEDGSSSKNSSDDMSEGSGNKSLMPDKPDMGSSLNTGSSNRQTMPTQSNSSVPSHYLTLSGNRTMEGKMEITDKLMFETKFGSVGIGVEQIKGIRFHADGDDAAIIVLRNGDTITGVPKLDNVNITTEWGRAEIETKFIESVVITPNARFQLNSNAGGPGWILLN